MQQVVALFDEIVYNSGMASREEISARAKEKRADQRVQKRQKMTQQIRKNIAFSVLSAVMPKTKALQLAGYSPCTVSKVGIPVVDLGTVQQIRERLNQVAGCTLADQVGWYVSVREDADVPTTERIAAARRLDAVLGYDAPQKVDVSQRHEIAGAVAVFHRLMSSTGMRPSDIVKIAEAEVVETTPPPLPPKEIENEPRTETRSKKEMLRTPEKVESVPPDNQ
jgi:hypothetical protein